MVQLSLCKCPPWDAKVIWDTESTYIVASLVFCQGQPNGRETCIVLESSPTRSLVIKLLQCPYANFILQSRNAADKLRSQTGVCKTLLPNVVVPEAHQDDHSYIYT